MGRFMNVMPEIFRFLYWPICRIYVKIFLGDKPADEFLRKLCSLQFRAVHGFWPNFRAPRRFSEKVWSRMLHERDPKLTILSDKLTVRNYVAEKVGREYLIPLLWQGTSPERIPFDNLPCRFVIKTNHGCGYNIIVYDKSKLDQDGARKQLKKWLKQNFARDTYLGIAWGYKNITPAIMVETFLGQGNRVPVDYKFYCFSGRVELITLHFDRFGVHRTRSYDRNFQPHEFRYDFDQWDGEFQCPHNFEEMVRIAEVLASEFDFIRVDMYSVDSRVYFSELTPYPGGVATKFLPERQDYILGTKWTAKRE